MHKYVKVESAFSSLKENKGIVLNKITTERGKLMSIKYFSFNYY